MKNVAPVLLAIAAVGLIGACGDDSSYDSSVATTTSVAATTTTMVVTPGTPSAVLASTPWETTSAANATGAYLPLTDPNVSNYVGFAYFKPDGTFTMYNLDDSPKMQGDWSVSPDGKTRTLVVRNDAGEEQFRRDVDIVTLIDTEFTYRVYPDAEDKSVYFDIIHTPTDHPEPSS
ncbi:DUF4822 domain-containing protein [Nocardia cyriacigeorgica]|uniref:DUF4822 domain-containing protein n=2 Tax=Nocardia cyriacigeorgica TaxID=135487 RepID=A0A6P1D1M2_9NOCA|nr:DUF4822 domain-containing protein [Nocardia cyriacigeorgica]NEW38792.1 DUF4822 domain-containing protein [Nocardia cyriacigeorgica]NEW44425.1 DUF4822 domain-containing protein [Nocardia cyriacigeorgica]